MSWFIFRSENRRQRDKISEEKSKKSHPFFLGYHHWLSISLCIRGYTKDRTSLDQKESHQPGLIPPTFYSSERCIQASFIKLSSERSMIKLFPEKGGNLDLLKVCQHPFHECQNRMDLEKDFTVCQEIVLSIIIWDECKVIKNTNTYTISVYDIATFSYSISIKCQ